MLHKQVALDATTTDQGHFDAIAATWSVDRSGERIIKGAFAETIEAWRGSGKRVPVHWNHKGEAENVIGSVDPRTMTETDLGLYVEGDLDLTDSEVAREVWRSMKNGSISLSFGYMVTADREAKDGIRELLGIDLFEITFTPSPANAETRILEMKSASAYDFEPEFQMLKEADRKAERVHEEAGRQLKAEEREAKRARPIRVRTFEA
jgi:HK97 family phage prohead protease